jgi:hypothetical protein
MMRKPYGNVVVKEINAVLATFVKAELEHEVSEPSKKKMQHAFSTKGRARISLPEYRNYNI